MNVLKSLLFLVVVPGTIAGFLPLGLLRVGPRIQTGFPPWLALPLWLAGGLILLRCFLDFVRKGRGTPAPIDPPKELVLSGLYRYIRNPMYAGVISILCGHFAWFGYWAMLAYTLAVFTAFHLFVVRYEEPALRQKFGAAYEAYLGRVPRWIPKI
jgi:protein-S-isoprenylcysteine O-methyltransferase Ste14